MMASKTMAMGKWRSTDNMVGTIFYIEPCQHDVVVVCHAMSGLSIEAKAVEEEYVK